jgi:Uma2 family endonuclease
MVTNTLLTVEQFLELPRVKNDDYRRYELWQGELVEMGETIPWHNWVRERILFALSIYLSRTARGVVLLETGIQFDTNTLYRPDVSFWDSQRWTSVDLRKSPVEVVPQLVVEVKSPSNSIPELFGKASHYIRSGVDTVWVVLDDPFKVHVFETTGARRMIVAGENMPSEKLEAPFLLPDFSIEISELLPPHSGN